ncbi:beta-glucosidase BglX [Lactobacillus sp. B4026]|uniref:beta-glucosidase BglX n=1 Tax=Lactobacillus sp. B4026 TaxID=2818035 RepID=UPI00226BAA4E|nr:beta-glucosidase BglX [Lactobacillus sp. B4026]MCX8737487.1 beta-glucosidase BglX [Lactobacillus sp. B4026]
MNQKEIIRLLKDMSLDEKIGQLIQLSGEFFSANDISIGPIEKLGISKKMVDLTGSILNVVGAKETHEVQERQMQKQPHHIPVLFMSDVIYGYKTILPIPLGLGATWDLKNVRQAFVNAADEASAAGNHVAFAPMVDVVRDARWGRVLESPGEDPYLNARFAENMVNGLQENLKNKKGQAACVKHYAAYGAVEGGKEYNSVDMSISNLFQNYLPPYKAAVAAGSEMVMTSLTTLNGVPATASKALLSTILRQKWGFDGVIISDYASIFELIKHGFAANEIQASEEAFNASVDIDMKSPCYANGLQPLVTNGQLDEEKIDQAVLRVLNLKNRLGLFEDPFYGASPEREAKSILTSSKRQLARKLSQESLVLLQNDNHVLPLNKEQKVVLIGPYASRKTLIGMWAIHGNPQDTITIADGMKRFIPDLKVYQGTDLQRSKKLLKNLGFLNEKEIAEAISTPKQEQKNNQEALEAAKKADTVVLALGEETYEDGEAGSKTDLRLPKNQRQLIDQLANLGKKIILVLINGRPLVLNDIKDKVDAIIEAWFPGTEGGNAIADVLFGECNPSGRLTMEFPYSSAEEPLYYNHLSTGRPESNSQHKGRFVSKYLDCPSGALYPFGYGLSYCDVDYSSLQLSANEITPDQDIKVSINVTNTGKCSTTETVQLYFRDEVASVAQPVKRLINFQKVQLKPMEKKRVEFVLSLSELSFFDNTGNEKIEPGFFTIMVGPNSRDVSSARLYFAG